MSSGEKRKNLRRSITYPAFIDLGDGLVIECTLCDASQQGALLAVAEPDSVPDQFILALSSGGAARRRCRVAWRSNDQVGVAMRRGLTLHSTVHSAARGSDAAADGGADQRALRRREHYRANCGADSCTGGRSCNRTDRQILRGAKRAICQRRTRCQSPGRRRSRGSQ